jgi:hypothetical protein
MRKNGRKEERKNGRGRPEEQRTKNKEQRTKNEERRKKNGRTT